MLAFFAKAVLTNPDGTKSIKLPINEKDDVWVWQAEEVQENGVWQRYYGIVSAHGIAKVSANEIEFADKN
ncbi:MAG: hypothetical protein ACYC27_21720 [Armatimonadota bacterium]